MERKTSMPGGMRARIDSLVEQVENEMAKPPSVEDLLKLPKKKAVKPRPSRPKSHAESFKDLDGWYDEAVAGMPDDALARAANVSMTAVLEWRKERKIERKKGWERKREAEVWAVDAFGTGFIPDIQEVHARLKQQWDLPQYALRTALDYDELSRALFFLHWAHGTAPDALAKAFGLRERDVVMAIAVETAHLAEHGMPCKVCSRVCDPAYGKYCSVRCKQEDR